jgi:hypothetical protein
LYNIDNQQITRRVNFVEFCRLFFLAFIGETCNFVGRKQ